MIVSINQPAYLPWLGYYHRILQSDVHVILDHVQFEKNSFTNRNKIRAKDGSIMLTVPVKTKGLFGQLAINTIEIVQDGWKEKHWKSIQSLYCKAKFYAQYEPFLKQMFAQHYTKLIDFILPLTQFSLQQLHCQTKILRSSQMQVDGSKSDLVLHICKAVNATKYLSGPFGKNYLNVDSFNKAGIEIVFHNYIHPIYPQVYAGFEPYMAFIDLLLNTGSDAKNFLNLYNEQFI